MIAQIKNVTERDERIIVLSLLSKLYKDANAIQEFCSEKANVSDHSCFEETDKSISHLMQYIESSMQMFEVALDLRDSEDYEFSHLSFDC